MSGVWSWFTDSAHWAGDGGIPQLLLQHLAISLAALMIASVVALPLAIWAGHTGRGVALLSLLGTVGRALPIYGVIVTFALVDTIGVSAKAVVLGLTVFAVPPLLVNTSVAVRSVQPAIKDAARGMGMTGAQRLRLIELPLAFPLIFAGVRTTTVQVVATASFGALVGAGTLGDLIVTGLALQDYAQLYAGVVLIAVLCLVLDQLLALTQLVTVRRERT